MRAAGRWLVGTALLAAGLLPLGCDRASVEEAGLEAEEGKAQVSADLYFPSSGGMLTPEARQLTAGESPAARIRGILEALLAGPESAELAAPFAAAPQVTTVYLSPDGTVYVDLKPPEESPPLAMGSTEERQAVMSVVNTVVFNIPEAERVVLLWNGSQPTTFAGHLDTSMPLAPDPSLVAR